MASGVSAVFPDVSAEQTVFQPHQLLFLTPNSRSALEMMNTSISEDLEMMHTSICEALEMMNTSICECNATVNNPHQCAAFYLSALGCVFQEIRVLARDLLREKGFQLNELNESTMQEFAIVMRGWIDGAKALAAFGQLVLILYKNIDRRNYFRYFQARANALKAQVGVIGQLNPAGGDVVLSFEAALRVKQVIGNEPKLRAGVLKILIANETRLCMIGNVSRYCCEMISWTEMSSLKFIYDELCMTESPVLVDTRVREEVINFYESVEKTTEQQYPQFFRIFEPTEAARYLNQSRFATLAEVARRVKQGQSTTVVNFATARSTEANTLVSDLVREHRRYMVAPNQMPGIIERLRTVDPLMQMIIKRLTMVEHMPMIIEQLTMLEEPEQEAIHQPAEPPLRLVARW